MSDDKVCKHCNEPIDSEFDDAEYLCDEIFCDSECSRDWVYSLKADNKFLEEQLAGAHRSWKYEYNILKAERDALKLENELLRDNMMEIRGMVRPIIQNAPQILETATPTSGEQIDE